MQSPSAFHPNALLLRAGYDDPAIHAHLRPNFVAHTTGDNPTAGDWLGEEMMAEHIRRIIALSGGTMRVEPIVDFALANERFGVVFSRATAERGEQRLDQYVCGI